jgi:transglutaminase-like putative cysteine protease
MRFDIRYRTRFSYEAPVSESHNELRACPVTDEHQRLVTYRVGVIPNARPLSFTDYWGTRVDAFGVRLPHRVLEVVAEATVETSERPPFLADAVLNDLADLEFVSRNHEWLQPTRHTNWDDELLKLASECVASSGPLVADAAVGIHDLVRASLTYEKGVTDIGTPVSDVLHGGAGVCQDFAHLAVALARSVGIPARYVSGYLFSADDATAERTDQPVVHVQTHAWIEAAIPGAGWFPLDPTNGRKVDEMHVKVGHGRDYDDVSPFRGVHQGVASASLEAAVEIRKGEPMLPGGLFSMLDATWGDTPGTPLRVTLGARTPIAMPALDQETQQQQQQQQ